MSRSKQTHKELPEHRWHQQGSWLTTKHLKALILEQYLYVCVALALMKNLICYLIQTSLFLIGN